MKKLISIVCALAMMLSMVGCGQSQSAESADVEAQAGTSLTAMVTAIDGSIVSLQLGELAEMDMSMPEGDAQMPQMGGDPQQSADNAGNAMPEMPSGGMGGNKMDGAQPEMPGGEQGEAPDMSGGFGGGRPDGSIPQMPDGEQPAEGSAPQMSGQDGTMPEMPGGGQGEAPDMSGDFGGGMSLFTAGEETMTLDLSSAAISLEGMDGSTEGSISDIAVGDILVIQLGSKDAVSSVTVKFVPDFGGGMGQMGQMDQMGMPGGGFGGSMEITQGTSANTIDSEGTYTGVTFTSTGDDENALRVTGAEVTLEYLTVSKEAGASSNTENGDFYGMNAALLATDGANVTINNITVNSSAQNGNGVFSYGEGTVVTISDSTIVTTADNSGGIQTTGGGTTNAYNLDISTSGSSAAAIRSDRGGGTVNVDGGTYTSSGYNSPAVYSTAAITVKNAVLTANNSEALVIEGKNSMALENCTVSGNMSDTQGTSSDINVHNVMIYQSMSGDADVGTSLFSMTGGSLTSNNGDMFFVTNTHSILTLSGVEIINRESDGYFLLVSGNDASRGWGRAGANGAQLEFTTDAQIMEGAIAVDSISTLSLALTNGSSFTGTINIIDNAQNGAAVANNAVITIDSGSSWTLTGDCKITSLDNKGTINFNGYTITLADGSILS